MKRLHGYKDANMIRVADIQTCWAEGNLHNGTYVSQVLEAVVVGELLDVFRPTFRLNDKLIREDVCFRVELGQLMVLETDYFIIKRRVVAFKLFRWMTGLG